MFGMLNYRAHKLYYLLTFPLRIMAFIIFISAIAVGIMVARSTDFAWWAKFIIAYLVFLLAVIIWGFLFRGLLLLFNRAFFWIVDVVPSKGGDHEEACVIVLSGELPLLVKKLKSKIENWTEEDTAKLASYAPWRCRLFFRKNIRERFRARVRFMQQYYEETGVQVGELPRSKTDELLKPYKEPWYELALASPTTVETLIASVFILMFTNA